MVDRSYKERKEIMARKPIDWSEAPDWAEWWAVDSDGLGWWFENKPHIINDPINEIKIWWAAGKLEDDEFDSDNWQQSLVQRPGEKKLK